MSHEHASFVSPDGNRRFIDETRKAQPELAVWMVTDLPDGSQFLSADLISKRKLLASDIFDIDLSQVEYDLRLSGIALKDAAHHFAEQTMVRDVEAAAKQFQAVLNDMVTRQNQSRQPSDAVSKLLYACRKLEKTLGL